MTAMNPVDPWEGSTPESRFMKIRPGTQKILDWNQNQILKKGLLIWSPIMLQVYVYMGLSENSVPLNPMVNGHYPY